MEIKIEELEKARRKAARREWFEDKKPWTLLGASPRTD